jgi:DNA primase
MDAVSEVKTRLSIEDVISEYVRLKRTGKNFKGLSPFTSEKTPSFIVSPEKQIWHDFSSGRGGDMFTFVQEVEGLDFKGSLEFLARKAGVDIEQYRSSTGGSKIDKERLYKILELAAKFYQTQLKANPAALDYLIKKRGFNKQTLLDFQLGYSPDNQKALTDFLLKKGYEQKDLKLTGLSVQRRAGWGDMFRGRIMIPLHDSFGRVVGFTARLLVDQDGAPKYINTSSTPLYDKSRHVFGLHLAKQAIREVKYSVLAEGNLDVVASHQAGLKQVVATAGTALTEYQLKALGRFSPDVRLAFDADKAGIAAAERAIPIASKTDISLGIITIPEGKDPDDLIKKDPKLWTDAIKNSEYAMDWLIDQYKNKLDIKSAKGKREFSDIIVEVLRGITDPVEQNHYLFYVADLMEVDQSSLKSKLTKSSGAAVQTRLKQTNSNPKPIVNPERNRSIEHLLSLALMLPGTRGYLDLLSVEMMIKPEQKTVLEFLQTNPQFDGKITESPQLRDIADFVKILSLQFEELYGAVDTLELQYEAARLRARTIEDYIREQKKFISSELKVADDETQRKLLARVRELDQLLSKAKEN